MVAEAISDSSLAASSAADKVIIIRKVTFLKTWQASIAKLKKMGNAVQSKEALEIDSQDLINVNEQREYHQFIKNINALNDLVTIAYRTAKHNNEVITLDYLTLFNDNLRRALPRLINQEVDLGTKLSLINELIVAAKPSPKLLEYVEPIVSPIVGLLGGILGFVIGIPVGAVAGLGFMIIALGNSTSTYGLDLNAIAWLAGIFAFAGACYGAYCGSIQGAQYLWSLNHNTFFKPSKIQDLVKITLTTKCYQRALARQLIEAEVARSDCRLPAVLNTMICDYLAPDHKEKVFDDNKPLLLMSF